MIRTTAIPGNAIVTRLYSRLARKVPEAPVTVSHGRSTDAARTTADAMCATNAPHMEPPVSIDPQS